MAPFLGLIQMLLLLLGHWCCPACFLGAQTLSGLLPGKQQLQGCSAAWISMNKTAECSPLGWHSLQHHP